MTAGILARFSAVTVHVVAASRVRPVSRRAARIISANSSRSGSRSSSRVACVYACPRQCDSPLLPGNHLDRRNRSGAWRHSSRRTRHIAVQRIGLVSASVPGAAPMQAAAVASFRWRPGNERRRSMNVTRHALECSGQISSQFPRGQCLSSAIEEPTPHSKWHGIAKTATKPDARGRHHR